MADASHVQIEPQSDRRQPQIDVWRLICLRCCTLPYFRKLIDCKCQWLYIKCAGSLKDQLYCAQYSFRPTETISSTGGCVTLQCSEGCVCRTVQISFFVWFKSVINVARFKLNEVVYGCCKFMMFYMVHVI